MDQKSQIRDYKTAEKYILSIPKFTTKNSLELTRKFYDFLGRPGEKSKIFHVAGTNGKGSVCAYLHEVLQREGITTGMFTSPHLVKYNERIELNGKDISDGDFAMTITAVKVAADSIVQKGVCEQPTQFEILTAAAFLYFHLQKVDYAVIEVGLGGLWDSTNIITPVVSVITNVSLDHTDRCGATVARIAMQKAGIIKEKVPVVTAAEGEEALGPIVTMAMFKEAPVYLYGKAFYGTEVTSSMDGQKFTLHAGDYYHSDYEIKLPGEHQIKNTSVAIVAAKLVSKQDARINEIALHMGVANTLWPGRLERIAQMPDLILDGAHNPDGALALRKALDKYYPGKKVHFVFGMMGDKDMSGVIKTLIKADDVVLTVRADGGVRAAEADALANLVGANAVAESDLQTAYHKAMSLAGEEGVVCVCGSLYLVGEFKAMLQREKEQCH